MSDQKGKKDSEKTSLITLISSTHGRMRREQRDIDKRDLQKALKYGKFTRVHIPNGHRWMVEYDGIVFITDASKKKEITAYPSALEQAPLSKEETTAHEKAKLILTMKPEESVTHTVIVMDHSGSMLVHDIRLHRDRHTAAYSATAIELVAEQLFNSTANNRDLVSLIEFDREARVVFSFEPVTWTLYNKILERRDCRRFKERQVTMMNDVYDSNYFPALDKAFELLGTGVHEDCALSLLFLSDGQPSDAWCYGYTPFSMERQMCARCNQIAERFREQLNVTMVGFGNKSSDFSIMESMVGSFNNAPGGSTASFVYCDKMASSLQTAISSTVTSLMKTRCAMLSSAGHGKTKRIIKTEQSQDRFDNWQTLKILHHLSFNPHTSDFLQSKLVPPGALVGYEAKVADKLSWSTDCPNLTISSKTLGEGAERVAFRCLLADSDCTRYGAMVAKETNLVDRIGEHESFHKTFLETQSLASYFAKEFNKRLRALPNFDENSTPSISFVPCSVLLVEDPCWPGGKRGILVEKMLDVERLEWKKWNNNAGAVEGELRHNPLDIDREYEKLQNKLDPIDVDHEEEKLLNELLLDPIAEEGSTGEDDMICDDNHNRTKSDSASVTANSDTVSTSPIGHEKIDTDESDEINPSDYLQAFSHFTYTLTSRKLLVCDLQGVYDASNKPPMFELTDPAIHYKSKSKEKQMVFGRTDKGARGIQLFFNTHKCSKICKLMQLGKCQTDWKQKWKDEIGICKEATEPQQSSQQRPAYNVIDLTGDENTSNNNLIDLTEDDDELTISNKRTIIDGLMSPGTSKRKRF